MKKQFLTESAKSDISVLDIKSSNDSGLNENLPLSLKYMFPVVAFLTV